MAAAGVGAGGVIEIEERPSQEGDVFLLATSGAMLVVPATAFAARNPCFGEPLAGRQSSLTPQAGRIWRSARPRVTQNTRGSGRPPIPVVRCGPLDNGLRAFKWGVDAGGVEPGRAGYPAMAGACATRVLPTLRVADNDIRTILKVGQPAQRTPWPTSGPSLPDDGRPLEGGAARTARGHSFIRKGGAIPLLCCSKSRQRREGER